MDIVDLLITFIIIGGSIFFSYRKKRRASEDVFTPFEEEEEFSPQSAAPFSYDETYLEENRQNPAKTEPFLFSTNINQEKSILRKSESKIAEIQFQEPENEEENSFSFSFSNDEVKNGFIYSEILKRPYNE